MRHGPQFIRLCTVGQMLMFASEAISYCYLKQQPPLGTRVGCINSVLGLGGNLGGRTVRPSR
jgi:hypothetical protein